MIFKLVNLIGKLESIENGLRNTQGMVLVIIPREWSQEYSENDLRNLQGMISGTPKEWSKQYPGNGPINTQGRESSEVQKSLKYKIVRCMRIPVTLIGRQRQAGSKPAFNLNSYLATTICLPSELIMTITGY